MRSASMRMTFWARSELPPPADIASTSQPTAGRVTGQKLRLPPALAQGFERRPGQAVAKNLTRLALQFHPTFRDINRTARQPRPAHPARPHRLAAGSRRSGLNVGSSPVTRPESEPLRTRTFDPTRTVDAAAQAGRLLRAAGRFRRPPDGGGRRVANGLRGRWIEAVAGAAPLRMVGTGQPISKKEHGRRGVGVPPAAPRELVWSRTDQFIAPGDSARRRRHPRRRGTRYRGRRWQ